jgi:hypothetical protein
MIAEVDYLDKKKAEKLLNSLSNSSHRGRHSFDDGCWP